MTTLPTNPLAAIIAAAKKELPTVTGATAKSAARIARGDVRVVVADISSSMAEMAGARPKWAVLNDALQQVPGTPVVAFGSFPVDVPPGSALPQPGGSTALHLALEHVASRDPSHVLVISDGHPDDPRAALAVADRIDARIDVIYCGPDDDDKGIRFMRRLARRGGKVHQHSFHREPQKIANAVRLLALPAR